jgi:hypothetical protein
MNNNYYTKKKRIIINYNGGALEAGAGVLLVLTWGE